MATEHTRGPWRVHATDETVILDASGDVVATTFLDGPDYEDNFERRAAHAKLIATAPALIDALRAAYKHITQPVRMTQTEAVYDARLFNEITSELRAVIAKSEG